MKISSFGESEADEELREKLDYKVGDIVQVKRGKNSGRVAIIMRISPHIDDSGEDVLSYEIKLSDREGLSLTGRSLQLIRRADAAEI
jgi:bifunctional DNA-binding transcriptional regulator/antitoxin component of YhaV-PrlF toxin-antitoxin module